MKIIKKSNNLSFMISQNEPFSMEWFSNNKINSWEQNSFHIFDHYKNNKGIYIDIGSWIGPTVLYCANIYKKVIAIEPDPVAISRLKKNISVNTFDNIVLIEKGLSFENGKTNFGGNGILGNSMSTLLISNKEEYLSYKGKHQRYNQNSIVEIETITIESLIKQQNIDPKNISLIKMDIEGGEKIVVPSLVNFLNKHKPVFYISLHRSFLKESDIDKLIDILFNIYNKCYYFSDNGEKKLIDKNFIKSQKLNCLVFE